MLCHYTPRMATVSGSNVVCHGTAVVEVVIQHQDQDVAVIPNVAHSHIELSISKWMLPHTLFSI